MIIFWIFTLFFGASVFSFALFAFQLGVGLSLFYALMASVCILSFRPYRRVRLELQRAVEVVVNGWDNLEKRAKKLPVAVMLVGVALTPAIATCSPQTDRQAGSPTIVVYCRDAKISVSSLHASGGSLTISCDPPNDSRTALADKKSVLSEVV